MEFTSVTLFQGKLAHYSVSSADGLSFNARLFKYGGSGEPYPPEVLSGIWGGRHWRGDEQHQELLDDLGFATKEQFKNKIN